MPACGAAVVLGLGATLDALCTFNLPTVQPGAHAFAFVHISCPPCAHSTHTPLGFQIGTCLVVFAGEGVWPAWSLASGLLWPGCPVSHPACLVTWVLALSPSLQPALPMLGGVVSLIWWGGWGGLRVASMRVPWLLC